jgi:GrpB-like predicted nucleotidyltransferase (UPF0157 family)
MKVSIDDYNPAWPEQFSIEAERLSQALDGRQAQIEHIGSTSVPGLAAKPILDMLIGLPSEDDLDAAAFALLPLGYLYIRYYERIMPYRRYLIRVVAPADAELPVIVDSEVNKIDQHRYPHTHHLHMVAIGSEFWTRHLLFREHLRSHAEDRDAYASLKRELAQQDWESGNHYAAAKTDFIQAIEAKART